ncbi:MAG TPA: hypothetical protein VEU96_08320 [Bryobacteraceae bacterium]|nr:hypothetical protein [Bryobacteraceae bacterium]
MDVTDLGVHHPRDFFGHAVLTLKPNHAVGRIRAGLAVGLERQSNLRFIGSQHYRASELAERRQRRAALLTWIQSIEDTCESCLAIITDDPDGLVESKSMGARELWTENRDESKNRRFRRHEDSMQREMSEIKTKL